MFNYLDFQLTQFLSIYFPDEYLEKFYPAPYSAIVGHNEKTISRITPSKCARMCLMEREFICRSFDYQVR